MKRISFDNTRIIPYAFIVPSLLFIFTFMIYPVTTVFYYSTRNYDLNRPQEFGFIGLENFRKIMFEDEIFRNSLWVSLKWVSWEVCLQLIAGLIIALILNQQFKVRGLIRALIISPWAVSGVLTTMIWSLMFNHQIGLINDVFMKLGLINRPVAWLGNLNTVFKSVVTAELWRGIPFFALIILSGLQSIPKELYESCKVDGGGRVIIFRKITLPYLKDTIIVSTLMRSVWEFNNVDMIYTLTGGGPMHLTTTMPIYVFKNAIEYNNFGYGSALTIIGFSILSIFAVGYLSISGYGKGDV